MIVELTEEDIRLINKLNFLRFDRSSYIALIIGGILFLIATLFVPYNGWRIKPATPPKDFYDYFTRLIPYLIFEFFFFFFLPLIDWIIKKIELNAGKKRVVFGYVTLKTKLLFKRKIIVYSPFLLIIYRRSYHFMDIEKGDKVKMELTYLGRLLKYEKIDKTASAQHAV